MPGIVIKIIWDDFSNVGKQFGQQQDEIRGVNKKLKSAKDALDGGKGWVGVGATKFFREFDQDVFPAMKRLEGAMGTAQQAQKQIHKIMKQAEDDWKVIFQKI
jgi:WXG100 family type VII secretion target